MTSSLGDSELAKTDIVVKKPVVPGTYKGQLGGYRPNGGRPKGARNKTTKQRQMIKQRIIDRIHEDADKLLNAQMNKALGETYLMIQRTIGTGSKQRRETEIVTDPEIVRQYLDDELNNTDEEYYFMTTKPADVNALRDLFDRAFGKPDSKVENVGESKVIVETRVSRHANNKD